MYIGQLSKATGASVKAIRHYESLGLMRNIQRQGSYRVYEEHHIVIIKMILMAKTLGFKLKDIKPLIDQKYQTNSFPLEVAYSAIDTKKLELQQYIVEAKNKIEQLDQLKVELDEMFG